MAGIRLEHVRKVYPGNVEVIPDLNLEIQDKEFIVFVGPSGCGKSTTLRMIAGLEEVTSGKLSIGDRVVNDIPPKDRDIAMVFQNYALYPHMTVYDNMAFGLTLRKMPKDEIDKKVREAAEILDLTKYLQRKPKALSGGQRQRVALGRAMVRNPAVFLLDEPLSNLDAKLRTAMRAEIIKLHKHLATTFVYVTHDQTEAMTMGDRICVLKDGYIQQFDTPQNLFDYPANLFVGGFIGSPQMNFIEGRLYKTEEGYLFKNDWFHVPPSAQLMERLDVERFHDGMDVVLGVRPEAISVKEGEKGHFEARCELAERMGSEIYLYLKPVGDEHHKNIIARIPTTKADYQDQVVGLEADTKHLYFFDKETGLSLFPEGRTAPSLKK